MNEYIDIQKAAKYTGKSVSTIKRLINEIKEDKDLYTKVLKQETTKTGFKYIVSKDYLKNHFKIKATSTRSKTAKNELVQKVGHELVQTKENELLKKDVKHLQERIKDKDNQIEHLQTTNTKLVEEITNHTKQLRELNFIIATQQQQQLEGTKSKESKPKEEAQEPQKNIEPTKQSGLIFILSILLIIVIIILVVLALD